MDSHSLHQCLYRVARGPDKPQTVPFLHATVVKNNPFLPPTTQLVGAQLLIASMDARAGVPSKPEKPVARFGFLWGLRALPSHPHTSFLPVRCSGGRAVPAMCELLTRVLLSPPSICDGTNI